MTSCQTDVVQIVETSAELGTYKWVSGWFKLARNTVRLETEDACSNEVDIVSPSSNDWVSFDTSTRNASCSQTRFEACKIIVLVNLPFQASAKVILFPLPTPSPMKLYVPVQLKKLRKKGLITLSLHKYQLFHCVSSKNLRILDIRPWSTPFFRKL